MQEIITHDLIHTRKAAMSNGQGAVNKMKNEAVRSIGRAIEALEDRIDAAHDAGTDTTAMEAELDALEVQLKAAQAQKKLDQTAARDARKAAHKP